LSPNSKYASLADKLPKLPTSEGTPVNVHRISPGRIKHARPRLTYIYFFFFVLASSYLINGMEKEPPRNEKFEAALREFRSNDPRRVSLDLSDLTLTNTMLLRLKQAIQDNTEIGYIKFPNLSVDNQLIADQIHQRCAGNNQLFEPYPNDFMLGVFSSHVYDDRQQGDKLTITLDNGHEVNEPYWYVNQIFYDKESDYYAILYRNDKTHQLVLAHRGTVPGRLLKQDSSLQTDIKGVLQSGIVKQQACAYAAAHEAVERAKESGYRLSTTGHSLGAWLAELATFFCHVNFNFPHIRCVTFDSPGSKNIFNKLRSNIDNLDTRFDPVVLQIVTYLSLPNIVNICNEHVGKIYALDHINIPALLEKLPQVIKKGFAQIDLIQALTTAQSHLLSKILVGFDPVTCVPREYKEMLDWPKLSYNKSGTDDLLADALTTAIGAPYVPSFVGKLVAKPLIGFTSPLTQTTAYSIISVLADYFNGKLDITQFISLIDKYLVQEGNVHKIVTSNVAAHDEFYLHYQSHYHEKPDKNREILNKDISTDKLLYLLNKYPDVFNQLKEQHIKEQLKPLLDAYIITEEGNKLIIRPSGSTIDNVTRIKFKLARLNSVLQDELRNICKPALNPVIVPPIKPLYSDHSAEIPPPMQIKPDKDSNGMPARKSNQKKYRSELVPNANTISRPGQHQQGTLVKLLIRLAKRVTPCPEQTGQGLAHLIPFSGGLVIIAFTSKGQAPAIVTAVVTSVNSISPSQIPLQIDLETALRICYLAYNAPKIVEVAKNIAGRVGPVVAKATYYGGRAVVKCITGL
jgi:hypothetical protein